jgi:hypothetical protein
MGGAASAVERASTVLSHRALTLSRVVERSDGLEHAWHVREAALTTAETAAAVAIATKSAEKAAEEDAELTVAAPEIAPGAAMTAAPADVSPAIERKRISPQLAEKITSAYKMSKRFKVSNADVAGQPAGSAKAAREGATSDGTKSGAYWNALGGLMIEHTIYQSVLAELPRRLPIPKKTASAICSSLAPVMLALNDGLDPKSADYRAAQAAYASWNDVSWVDPRDKAVRAKPAKGWTTEQYGMPGFAGLYAKGLHLARVATIRQIMLWLLESAPGLPRDAPLSIGDLGAGTCAACLGARFALRDYAGGEHPFKVWPIDVGSSSAGFAAAFRAMVEAGGAGPSCYSAASGYTKEALLPGQRPDQYLSEEAPGVDQLVGSLLEQVKARGERQPHVVIASFALHYVKTTDRLAFFTLLRRSVTRPMLLLIVKGVDSLARHETEPMVPVGSVPSVFLGLHYFIGRNPRPRVAEAHVALIRPASSDDPTEMAAPLPRLPRLPDEYSPADADSWVLCTFAALERRCLRHGVYTGLTELAEEKLAVELGY